MKPKDSWAGVEAALLAHHHKPDREAARALYSAIAAHRLKGQPVWPMLVAPPGSLKTELLEALDGLPGVHIIDKVTPNTFLSGQIPDGRKRTKISPSLLHRIGPDGIIAYPDFSTVLSMNRDRRGEVLADMRRIYDGHLRKEYGTVDSPHDHEWRGRITFAVATTDEVDGKYGVFQTLGERFVMVRWHRPGGTEAALTALKQDTRAAKAALRQAVHGLLKGLPDVKPELTEEIQEKIAALAEFAVRARTHIPRSGYNKDIIYVPEPEAPTRLAQQLAQLTKGSALLAGRDTADSEDLKLTQRVALDCIPDNRRKILDALIAGKNAAVAMLPPSTLSYAIEDLETQGLLQVGQLSQLAKDLLRQAGVL